MILACTFIMSNVQWSTPLFLDILNYLLDPFFLTLSPHEFTVGHTLSYFSPEIVSRAEWLFFCIWYSEHPLCTNSVFCSQYITVTCDPNSVGGRQKTIVPWVSNITKQNILKKVEITYAKINECKIFFIHDWLLWNFATLNFRHLYDNDRWQGSMLNKILFPFVMSKDQFISRLAKRVL